MALPPTPVIIDPEFASSVAGLRALRDAGLAPAVVGTTRLAAGLWSRGISARVLAPHSDRDPAGFADALARAASAGADRVVAYPGTEAGIDAVLDAAARRKDIALPFPAQPTRLLRQKSALPALGRSSGLPVVPTIAQASAAELLTAGLRFPCVVKSPAPGGSLNRTRVVRAREDLHSLLAALPPDEPLLVQPDVRGHLVSLVLVVDGDGAIVERFQHLAVATWPMDAGNTAQGLSLPPDERLIARAAAFLADVGYSGLAQMDFLETADGLALVDVNPRYYGSLALALRCGVNLPAAWHAVVAGTAVPGPSQYRAGVAYRWLEADIIAALRGSPGHLLPRRAVAVGAMWDRTDPVASVMLGLTSLGTVAAQRISEKVRTALPRATPVRSLPAEPPSQGPPTASRVASRPAGVVAAERDDLAA